MALVRFPLKMADGFNANTLEQLKEHFDIKSVVGYFYDRRLIRWLKINGCAEELSAVEKLSKLDRDLGRKLGEIFGVDGGPEPTLPAWIVEIMNRLKQYTDDKELLAQVEKELLESTAHVAFSQEELDERVTKFGKIYLVSSRFVIPLNATDKTYVGIGESARAVIKNDKIVDFAALNITFEKIRFDDDFQKLVEQSPEPTPGDKQESLIVRKNRKPNKTKPSGVFYKIMENVEGLLSLPHKGTDHIEKLLRQAEKMAEQMRSETKMKIVGDCYGRIRKNDKKQECYRKAESFSTISHGQKNR